MRLPTDILGTLQNEAETRNLSLNALVTTFLYKVIICELDLNTIPNITISQKTLKKIIEKVDESEFNEMVKDGPKVIQNLFLILNHDYNLDNVIEHFFNLIGEHWGWFQFSYSNKNDQYRLVFKTSLGLRWKNYLTMYVTTVLDSLKVRIKDTKVGDSAVVFKVELVQPQLNNY